jgi:hypothetical protein
VHNKPDRGDGERDYQFGKIIESTEVGLVIAHAYITAVPRIKKERTLFEATKDQQVHDGPERGHYPKCIPNRAVECCPEHAALQKKRRTGSMRTTLLARRRRIDPLSVTLLQFAE